MEFSQQFGFQYCFLILFITFKYQIVFQSLDSKLIDFDRLIDIEIRKNILWNSIRIVYGIETI